MSIAVWASRPHGNPLNGKPLRTCSPSTQAAAPQSGQPGSRRAARSGTAITASITTCAATRATYAPLLTAFIHQMSGPMKAAP